MTTLYLIRHPPPAIAPGLCYGQSDIGLLAAPWIDAQRLALQLPALDALYSSPLQRCRLLAEHLHSTPLLDERLQEINFGDWEGQPWDAIPRLKIDAWARQVFDFTPPNGESVREMAARVLKFADELTQQPSESRIGIITHQGPLRVLMAHFLGEDMNDIAPDAPWLQRAFGFASLTSLDLNKPTPT